MSAPPHPLHEVVVDAPLVRCLLAEQHPDLAHLPLVRAGHGWDNVTFRLGDALAVRLPARQAAAALVEHEQRWLPALAPLLTVAVPTPVRVGRPGAGYAWPWSVVPWLAGTAADELTAQQRDRWAPQLGSVLATLHRRAPATAPLNPVRGVPLRSRAAAVEERLVTAEEHLRTAWRDGLAAPEWDGPPVWLHGDPHPANLLATDGDLAALLDWGDATAGDPASDLGTVWAAFTAAGRARFWAAYAAGSPYAADEARFAALRTRARAWAAAYVPVYLAHPDEHPGLARAGAHAARELATA